MFQYSAIKLSDDFTNYVNDAGSPIGELNNLSKVNIFVGPNNSGKSRFLRKLSQMRNIQFHIAEKDINEFNKFLLDFREDLSKTLKGFGVKSIGELSERTMISLREIEWFAHHSKELEEIRKALRITIEMPQKPSITTEPTALSPNIIILAEKIREIGKKYSTTFNNLPNDLKAPIRVYLPILRGLRYLNIDSQDKNIVDLYEKRTDKDYYPDNAKRPDEVFTGQKLYDAVKRMLLSERAKRDSVAAYEKFLSNRFFENEPVTLIPNIDDDVLHIRIGKREYPIYDEGDGIQALILISFPLFKAGERTLYFIEEPETHLHPGLQRKLIELLCNDSNYHQFFLTTHSNHFLDLTFDYSNISVYSFRKTDGSSYRSDSDTFQMENVSSGEDNLLKNLGVRTSSVFLTNCTIWVEGVTDRWYYRKFLDEYQNSLNPNENAPRFKEDIHFTFVEYGGSNITHWSFLDKEVHPINVDRLCGKSMLIADEDGLKKIERLKQLEEKLGNRFIKPRVREVENLLSPQEIYSVLKEYEKREFDFNVKHDHYRHEPLGSFLDGYFSKNSGSARDSRYSDKSSKSGTISRKVHFCEKALKAIKWKTMTTHAKEIAKSIYDFIKEQNV